MKSKFSECGWVASPRLLAAMGLCGFVAFFIYEGILPTSTFGSVTAMGFLGSIFMIGALKTLEHIPPKYRLLATAGMLFASLVWFISTPHNYNDCVLQGIKDAKNEQATRLMRKVLICT